jgi:hypothetical protein
MDALGFNFAHASTNSSITLAASLAETCMGALLEAAPQPLMCS